MWIHLKHQVLFYLKKKEWKKYLLKKIHLKHQVLFYLKKKEWKKYL